MSLAISGLRWNGIFTGLRRARLGLMVVAVIAAPALSQESPPGVPPYGYRAEPMDDSGGDDANRSGRMREGAEFTGYGFFRATGDRVTFYDDAGNVRFRGLENLTLERIGRAIEETPTQVRWKVKGVITEFRGANFLLVTHAVMQTRNDEPDGAVLSPE